MNPVTNNTQCNIQVALWEILVHFTFILFTVWWTVVTKSTDVGISSYYFMSTLLSNPLSFFFPKSSFKRWPISNIKVLLYHIFLKTINTKINSRVHKTYNEIKGNTNKDKKAPTISRTSFICNYAIHIWLLIEICYKHKIYTGFRAFGTKNLTYFIINLMLK